MKTKIRRLSALLLALSLLLTACSGGGNGATATTMRLQKTQGTVGVSDGGGTSVEPREGLGLYSGYGVGTERSSYAWVDLDEVKLTKLDENSEIEIKKEGKQLEIEVKSGSLFFNVTEPLAADETLNIRSSTMVVGIRGTCGWVAQDAVGLLEGTVTVTAGDQPVTVTAGEMAVLAAEGEIVVSPFDSSEVPAFVLEELGERPTEFPAEPTGGGSADGPQADGPIPLLLRQTGYDQNGALHTDVIFSYDEQGYIQRFERNDYFYVGEVETYTEIITYSYDGQGNCVATASDGSTRPVMCEPGNFEASGWETSSTDGEVSFALCLEPLCSAYYDRRPTLGPGNRYDGEGFYAIYTFGENGLPIAIASYLMDGTPSGTATLAWKIME